MKQAGVWLWVIATLAIGVGLASCRYLIPGAPGGAPNILANAFARYGVLTAHAALGATALILGALQFFPGIRARWPAWRRRAGTVYVSCCLIGDGDFAPPPAGGVHRPPGLHAELRAFSLLCWVPNLIAAELILLAYGPLRTTPPLAAPSRSRG